MGKLLSDKNILIMGLRNKWSIAWGIAKAANDAGANLIFTYQSDREKAGVLDLVSKLNSTAVYACDVADDEQIEQLFSTIKEKYGVLHGVVHAIANAKSEDMQNTFVNTSRDGFAHAMEVSVYSLIAVSREAEKVMESGASIITLSYLGAERIMPGYNIMGVAKAALESTVKNLAACMGPTGIRVNGISAGPIKTIAAKGIKDFSKIVDYTAEKAPLRRNIELEDIGNSAVYLLSDLSKGVTGEIMHVDCGFNIVGV